MFPRIVIFNLLPFMNYPAPSVLNFTYFFEGVFFLAGVLLLDLALDLLENIK